MDIIAKGNISVGFAGAKFPLEFGKDYFIIEAWEGQVSDTCPVCNGSGFEQAPKHRYKCAECNGKGWVNPRSKVDGYYIVRCRMEAVQMFNDGTYGYCNRDNAFVVMRTFCRNGRHANTFRIHEYELAEMCFMKDQEKRYIYRTKEEAKEIVRQLNRELKNKTA